MPHSQPAGTAANCGRPPSGPAGVCVGCAGPLIPPVCSLALQGSGITASCINCACGLTVIGSHLPRAVELNRCQMCVLSAAPVAPSLPTACKSAEARSTVGPASIGAAFVGPASIGAASIGAAFVGAAPAGAAAMEVAAIGAPVLAAALGAASGGA